MYSGMKQIYIVDKDSAVSRMLKLRMSTYGFKVDTYVSSEEFFSAVPNSVPGFLLLNLHLPGLSGLETHKKLVKSGSKRPVIFISDDRNDELEKVALNAGAVGLLHKPVNEQELFALINKAI